MKYIAIIVPNEALTNETALSTVMFLTGDMAKKTVQADIPTSYFNYYFYGATIEVVEYENGQITDIHDIKSSDVAEFGLGVSYALTFNPATTGQPDTDVNILKLKR